jgi:hypothetical protein
MGGTLMLERNKPNGTVARVLFSAAQQPSAATRAGNRTAADKQTA